MSGCRICHAGHLPCRHWPRGGGRGAAPTRYVTLGAAVATTRHAAYPVAAGLARPPGHVILGAADHPPPDMSS